MGYVSGFLRRPTLGLPAIHTAHCGTGDIIAELSMQNTINFSKRSLNLCTLGSLHFLYKH